MPPPAKLAELADTIVFVSVNVPAFRMPPPPSALPFRIVTPEIAATTKTLLISRTREDLFPTIARLKGPAPRIVKFLSITTVPPVNVIVPATLTLMVSPADEIATAFRNEPGPLSNVLVTVSVLPKAEAAIRRTHMLKKARIVFVLAQFMAISDP